MFGVVRVAGGLRRPRVEEVSEEHTCARTRRASLIPPGSIFPPSTIGAVGRPGEAASGGLVRSALGGPFRPAGFRRPVEIHDAEYTDLSNGLLHAARAVGEDARSVLTGADLAFDLHVRTLGESAA